MAIEQPNILVAALALEAVAGQNDRVNIRSANGIDVASFVRVGAGEYTFELLEELAPESTVLQPSATGITQAGTGAICFLNRDPDPLPPYSDLAAWRVTCFQASDFAPMDSTVFFQWFNVRAEFDPILVT